MKSYEVRQLLEAYNEDELFYKEYHQAKQDKKTLLEFIARYSTKELFERKLIVKEIKDSWNPTNMVDEMYFPGDDTHDIYLSKHNRYTPLFTHEHVFFEIVYVLSGTCTQTIKDDSFTMKQGQLCIIAPLTKHSIGVFDDSIIINIVLRRKTFENVFYNLFRHSNRVTDFVNQSLYLYQDVGYMLLDTYGDTEIANAVLDMYDQYHHHLKYNELILNTELSYMIAKILQRYEDGIYVPQKSYTGNEDVLKIITYIETHFKDVTLADTADYFGYSSAYLSRLIKKHIGKPFKEIVSSIKFDKACFLLETTDLSVNEVGYQVGFDNNENFYRMFKKRYHMTPGEYRSNAKDIIVT